MERASGVLLPIFSLPGDYSCGSLGADARAFVDFLADAGFSWWQILPLCQTGEANSPYKSPAADSLNYAFIDLPTLAEQGLITEEELSAARGKTPYLCEHERLGEERLSLLFRAADRYPDRDAVLSYLGANPTVANYCRFMALSDKNGNAPFRTWQENTPDGETVYRYAFLQYECAREWDALRAYANGRGVKLLGDMPIYVDYESADVWANPHLFDLTAEGTPASVAGVPPDYFCADGQLWGNPLYNWERMAADGYAWWCARIARAARLFDGVRIDHFRAFASYYSVPASAPTAREGVWRVGPGSPLTDGLKKAAPGCMIVAEDLGVHTPDVDALLRQSGLPGMRVFQFAFSEGADNPHMPHNYENNCLAYTGTHDNDTMLGYLFSLDAGTRRAFFDYCGYAGDDIDAGMAAVRRTLLASHAGLAIFPIQDLLGYGNDTRINRPGIAEGNWQYRLTREQLAALDRSYFAAENRRYCR